MSNNDKLFDQKRELARRALEGENLDIYTEFSRVEEIHEANKKLNHKVAPLEKRPKKLFVPANPDKLRTGGVNPSVYREAPVINDNSPLYQQISTQPAVPTIPNEPELFPALSRDRDTSIQSTLTRLDQQQKKLTVPIVTATALPSQKQIDDHRRQHKIIIGIVLLILITLILVALQAFMNKPGPQNSKIIHNKNMPTIVTSDVDYIQKLKDRYETPTFINQPNELTGPIQQLRTLGISFVGISPLSFGSPIEVLRYQDDFMISFDIDDYPSIARALRQWEITANTMILIKDQPINEFVDETYLDLDYRVAKFDNESVITYTIINKQRVIIGSNPAYIMQNIKI